MKTKKLLTGSLILLAMFLMNDLFAQFKFSGEFRPRTELRHGYKTLPTVEDEAALFTSQRTRLNAYYKGDDFKVGFSLQDVRTWGDVKQLNTTDDHIFIHEAWGQYFFDDVFSIKLGRQELVYDDHRIFGSVNWAQQARSHDVAVFKFKSGNTKVDLGFAFNQDGERLFGTEYTVNGGNNYKAFQYLWFNHKVENFGISVLLLSNGMQGDTDVYYSQTYGLRMTYKYEGLSLAGSIYGQGGKKMDATPISAYYYAAEAYMKLGAGFKFGAGYEFLSGNDYDQIGNTSEEKAFMPLYGTNHKFNGHMDYFYVGNHGYSVGLKDFYLTLKFKHEKFTAGLTTHFFSADGAVMDMSRRLGTEYDFSLGYKFNDFVSFNAGYSRMEATETMEVLKGGSKDEGSDWAWVMFTFKPVFFKK